MNLLWNGGDMTVRDVHERLGRDGTDVAYTTVMTVMTRLAAKRLLTRRMEEGTYVYRPLETRCGFFATLSTRMLATIRRDFGAEAAETFAAQFARRMKTLFAASLVSLVFFAGVQAWAASFPRAELCRSLAVCSDRNAPRMTPAQQLSILPQSLP